MAGVAKLLLKMLRGPSKPASDKRVMPPQDTKYFGPKQHRSEDALKKDVESLFDVPEPFRSQALEVDQQMIDIEKRHRLNDPWDGLLWSEQRARQIREREFVDQLYDLDFRRREILEKGRGIK